jgi:hypothetical protein
MNDKFLVVYNICEIRGNNLFWYVECLENLLKQDYPNFHIVVSGCKVSAATKSGLRGKFGNKMTFSFFDEVWPVNVTFNKTVLIEHARNDTYDGFIYIDSGMNVRNQTNILSEINKRSNTRDYGMVTIQASTDTGYELWFGKPENGFVFNEDFIVPVGRCCNLHFQFFDRRLLEYYNRVIPDVFKTNCTESTFSFLNAALGLKWVFVKDIAVEHLKYADGASSGFTAQYYGTKEPWNNLLGDLDANKLIVTPEAKALGLGYEEGAGVMMHDPTLYDENGFAKNPLLKAYIKEYLFAPQRVVDYGLIHPV